jgi:hypothetical protein
MYFLIGLAIGVVLLAMAWWLRNKKVAVKWYDWVIGITGLALLMYTLSNITSFAASENSAPLIIFLIIGLPSLVLISIAGLMPWMRHRKSSR